MVDPITMGRMVEVTQEDFERLQFLARECHLYLSNPKKGWLLHYIRAQSEQSKIISAMIKSSHAN